MSDKKKMSKGKKIGIYLVIVAVVIAIASQMNKEKEADEKTVLPTYEIVSVDDVSIATNKRYTYNIVVSGQPSVSDLTEIGTMIIEQTKKERAFNALVVQFYDYKCFVGHGMRLGHILVCANGKIADSGKINTGDYDKMTTVIGINAVDWNSALTLDEAEMLMDFFTNATNDEEADTARVLEKYNKTQEQFDDIFFRYMAWDQPPLT